MTDEDIRRVIAEALDYAAVFQFRRAAIQSAFIAGEADMSIEAIALDSLSEMELCIAIEVNTGVSILPQEVRAMATLADLVAAVRKAV